MKKKIVKFIQGKGGIVAILSTVALVLIALFLIVVGNVYSSYNGDWSYIGEILSCPFAISLYVIGGLVIYLLLMIHLLAERHKEI